MGKIQKQSGSSSSGSKSRNLTIQYAVFGSLKPDPTKPRVYGKKTA
jgi:hypothetical protein